MDDIDPNRLNAVADALRASSKVQYSKATALEMARNFIIMSDADALFKDPEYLTRDGIHIAEAPDDEERAG